VWPTDSSRVVCFRAGTGCRRRADRDLVLLEFEGGLNLYVYVSNSPVNAIDPYGTCECSIIARCRPVKILYVRIFGAQHCYYVVKGQDQVVRTLSGGPDDSTGRTVLHVWNDIGDPIGENSLRDREIYRSQGSSQVCDDVDCLQLQVGRLNALTLTYQGLGPAMSRRLLKFHGGSGDDYAT